MTAPRSCMVTVDYDSPSITLAEARASWPTNPAWWRDGAAAGELEALYRDGETYLDLARRYRTNPDDIYKRVRELGLIAKFGRGPFRSRLPGGGRKFGSQRFCMCCRRPFRAAGKANRFCPRCNSSAVPRVPQ